MGNSFKKVARKEKKRMLDQPEEWLIFNKKHGVLISLVLKQGKLYFHRPGEIVLEEIIFAAIVNEHLMSIGVRDPVSKRFARHTVFLQKDQLVWEYPCVHAGNISFDACVLDNDDYHVQIPNINHPLIKNFKAFFGNRYPQTETTM